MRTRQIYFSIAFAICSAAGLDAFAATPFTGESRLVIYKVKSDGTKEVFRDFQMTEARDEEGSRFRRQVSIEGDITMLWVKSSGNYYRIDNRNRTRALVHTSPTPPGVLSELPKEIPATEKPRKEMAHGVECLRIPRFEIAGGVRREIGFSCISQELSGLIVQSYSPWSLQGVSYITEENLKFINLGAVPPSEWFRVPSEYRETKQRTPVEKK
jgi:hypothetical protein